MPQLEQLLPCEMSLPQPYIAMFVPILKTRSAKVEVLRADPATAAQPSIAKSSSDQEQKSSPKASSSARSQVDSPADQRHVRLAQDLLHAVLVHLHLMHAMSRLCDCKRCSRC